MAGEARRSPALCVPASALTYATAEPARVRCVRGKFLAHCPPRPCASYARYAPPLQQKENAPAQAKRATELAPSRVLNSQTHVASSAPSRFSAPPSFSHFLRPPQTPRTSPAMPGGRRLRATAPPPPLPPWPSLLHSPRGTRPARALKVRQPRVGLILSGEKHWELRGRTCRLRGLVALFDIDAGCIAGTAKIVASVRLTPRQLDDGSRQHRVSD